jgi:hypothetical protein
MIMANRKRRARRAQRRQVDRAERVTPPPEAAQHHRPWPMQSLLALGHPDGIDAPEFEAALQIVETWHALVRHLDIAGTALERFGLISAPSGGLSDRDAERIACWFDWSLRLPTGLPPRLVEWIEDDATIASVVVLRRACRLWDKVRSDRSSEQRGVAHLDNHPARVGLPKPVSSSYGETARRLAYLPATAPPIPAGLLSQIIPPFPAAAQMRQVVPPPVAALGRRR